jgi:hypothetical protein
VPGAHLFEQRASWPLPPVRLCHLRSDLCISKEWVGLENVKGTAPSVIFRTLLALANTFYEFLG